MYQRVHFFRAVLSALIITTLASGALAQTGRVGGTVKDEGGQPIKGATVTADNPNASPNSFTATTDDKGRFSIIGLRSGAYIATAKQPLTITLRTVAPDNTAAGGHVEPNVAVRLRFVRNEWATSDTGEWKLNDIGSFPRPPRKPRQA